MAGTARKVNEARFRKYHDSTAPTTVKCRQCNQIFANDISYLDHIIECDRKKVRHSGNTTVDRMMKAQECVS